MTTKRGEVRKVFKKYVQSMDDRPMDAICSAADEFKLQAQQLFLKKYMKTYPDWRSLLLYHEIGSGKTCTSITMAEEHMRSNPDNVVRVILPARLRTNFIDELISPCGMERYLTREDFDEYNSVATKARRKAQIRNHFMETIEERYDIMSFDKFRKIAMANKHDLVSWAKEWTSNSMIIVDEVHNLLSDKYDGKNAAIVLDTGVVSKSFKGFNSILLKVLSKFADPSAKLVFLTATPIFDNISQMKEIVMVMDPKVTKIPKEAKIKDVIDHLRGKVSYFPGTSANAYPSVEYIYHNIPLSKTQDEITNSVIGRVEVEDMDSTKESFMCVQRQVSIACLPKNKKVKDNIKKTVSQMDEYCPKVKEVLKVIHDSPGKHIVFSNFVQSGLMVVEQGLRNAGWKSAREVGHDVAQINKHKGKVYAFWDGRVKDDEKQKTKSIMNNKNNIHGDYIRVILGSPSIREGVSFKHVQHLHMLDPVWNQSARSQVEGRAIRFCSHVDIDENLHKPLRRAVVTHVYKSVPRHDGLVPQTCDQIIYDVIIENKKDFVQAGEAALKKVAIDHHLFKKMYNKNKGPTKTPPIRQGSAMSDISLDKDQMNVLLYKNESSGRNSNTCPSKRRPDNVTGMCKDPFVEQRKNKQDFMCCYKSKRPLSNQPTENKNKNKKPGRCPKKRRPDSDGNCKEGLYSKLNKIGEACCYKSKTGD
jgi:hypothetical protein